MPVWRLLSAIATRLASFANEIPKRWPKIQRVVSSHFSSPLPEAQLHWPPTGLAFVPCWCFAQFRWLVLVHVWEATSEKVSKAISAVCRGPPGPAARTADLSAILNFRDYLEENATSPQLESSVFFVAFSFPMLHLKHFTGAEPWLYVTPVECCLGCFFKHVTLRTWSTNRRKDEETGPYELQSSGQFVYPTFAPYECLLGIFHNRPYATCPRHYICFPTRTDAGCA